MEGVLVKIIFVGSLIGMGTIVFRKIPALTETSEISMQGEGFKSLFLKLLSRIIKFQTSFFNLILRKTLSGIKASTMIVHKKTDNKLKKLKQNTTEKNNIRDDKYWEKLKKLKNNSKD